LCTTTTQIQNFDPGGKRQNHNIRRFDVRQFPVFDEDCVLDFDEEIHTVVESKLQECWGSIEIKGRLDNETLRNIYNLFCKSEVVSLKTMLDIHDSFNHDGLTGLKKPK
jgi:hypothetical protein